MTEWALEARLGAKAHTITAHSTVEDGTVLLHGACEGTQGACDVSYLRAPKLSGDVNAWAALEIPNAVHARPVRGGGAVIASASLNAPSTMTLWRASQREGVRRLATVRDIAEPVQGLVVEDDGALTLRLGDDLRPTKYVVTWGGDVRLP